MEYENLRDIISFDGFKSASFGASEQRILKERLRDEGYHSIVFFGNSDAPGRRICNCRDATNRFRTLIYILEGDSNA